MRRHAFYHHNKSPHSVTCGFSSFVSDFFPPCRLQNSPCKTKLRPSPRWSCGCFKKVSELKKTFEEKLQITGGETFTRATKNLLLHAPSDWDQSSSRWRYAIVAGQMAHIPVLQNSLASLSLPRCALQFVSRAALVHACWLAGPDSGDPLKTPPVSQGFRTLTRGRLVHLLFFFLLSFSFPF